MADEAPEAGAARKRPAARGVLWLTGGLGALAGLVVVSEGRPQGGETAPIGALKTLNSAQTLFRELDKDEDGTLDYGTLRELSDATVIDGVLGSGRKHGYVFTCQQSPLTPEFLWFATASPAAPMTTGDRHFATNHAGVIYYSTLGPFSFDPSCALPGPGSPPDARRVGR